MQRASAHRPLRLVAFGGGTGLPVLLTGLRDADVDVTAVVTGRRRRRVERPAARGAGDRAARRPAQLPGGAGRAAPLGRGLRLPLQGRRDHSVGNIIIAALVDMSGGFCEGVEQAGRFLRIKGRVLPAATESLTLIVRYTDGSGSRGESTVRDAGRAVSAVTVEPEDAVAPAAVIGALREADIVVLAPGSLFTSTIAALLGGGVREALGGFSGPVVYVANLMTQPGETEGMTVSDHLRAIADHAGPVVTDVLVDTEPLAERVLQRYRAEGAEPVELDRGAVAELGVRLNDGSLHGETPANALRHDSGRLAAAVLGLASR